MRFLADILPLALTLFAGWCLWSITTTVLAMIPDLLPVRVRESARRTPPRRTDVQHGA